MIWILGFVSCAIGLLAINGVYLLLMSRKKKDPRPYTYDLSAGMIWETENLSELEPIIEECEESEKLAALAKRVSDQMLEALEMRIEGNGR